MVAKLTGEIVPQQISIYLGKRDFVDHVDTVEPIGQWVQKAQEPGGEGNGSWEVEEITESTMLKMEAN